MEIKKGYLSYNKTLKEKSRKLRNNSTLGEVLLWKQLRAGQMKGYKLNRQKPLGNYIVDFYCKKLNLVIEIDGKSHLLEPELDVIREQYLESLGLSVIRVTEMEVRKNMIHVLYVIESFIEQFEDSQESPVSR
ncbi:MAG: DNA methylase [Flavobacteriales bacterium]|nr:MAG: DNA methylase [Flavobacteriales bacterium]